ncbi:InlB B-repeat-containing protein [Bacillus sp. sid0103]|uniref:InlB B-repeat-containing protein n=1 Tax=Bacillus sp. sid0103 TaxID=2856337 RepID=UPI001C467B2B|nr:InlB B-repeat-containing protein [Bacillus sp. sid0103]MBV7504813.1 InlB B-repeat-containing protein [Bacillus sp. sid0103]
MVRKWFSYLLIAGLVFCLIPQVPYQSHMVAAETTHQTTVPNGYIGIYTASELDSIRNNFSANYILMNDIDVSEIENWTPIGSEGTPFTGKFDGNGYGINKLSVQISSDQPIYAGFIGYAKNATIQHLTMNNATVNVQNSSLVSNTSFAYAGAILGYGYNVNLVDNVVSGNISANSKFTAYAGGHAGYLDASYNGSSSVSNSRNTATVRAKTAVGGIIGRAYRATLSNVTNEANLIDSESDYLGGVVGYIYGNTLIRDALNTGKISPKSTGGGIAGYASTGSIENSKNQGEIAGKSNSTIGGILGSGNNLVISKTENNGLVVSSESYSDGGGIVGSLGSNSTILSSFNTADVTMRYAAGGIASRVSSSIISQTYNTGRINGQYAGGIIARSSNGTIEDSFNLGAISGSYDSGGIVGYGTDGSIARTYNIGVTSRISSTLGNIAGSFNGPITDSYFTYLSNEWKMTSSSPVLKTYAEMKELSTYTGFDFSSIWTMDKDASFKFPRLATLPIPPIETILNVSMASLPSKNVYALNEKLDLTNAVLSVRTTFGNESTVPITLEMISDFDAGMTGGQSVVVTYKGFSTSFWVTVKDVFEVTFTDYDGRVLKTEKVLDGDKATPPDPPTRTGYTFTGWSMDTTSVKQNLTVVAQYLKNDHTVTYMDGTNVLETLTYQRNSVVPLPNEPVKSGYTFLYWCSDPSFTTFYDPSVPLTEDRLVFAKFAKNPDKPTSVKVKAAGYDTITLEWTKVPDASSYIIQQEFSPGEWGNILEVHNGQNQYTIQWLEIGKTYRFKIQSVKWVESRVLFSEPTAAISATTVLTKIASVKATPISYDKVTVSWQPSTEAEIYEIYRADSQSGTFTLVGSVASDRNSFTVLNVPTGKQQYYSVRSVSYRNGRKTISAPSTPVSATTLLSRISTIKASAPSAISAKIEWGKVSGATSYEVVRSTSSTGTYSLVASTSSNSLINSNLLTGKTYYYKVRAFRMVSGKKVYSSYSNIVSVRPTLAKPYKLTVSKKSSTSSKLTWSKVSYAHGYEIYRSTSSKGTYTRLKTITSGTTVSYTNTGLLRRKTYYYKVRAYRVVSGKKVYSSFTSVAYVRL